ncbi:universal stress protein [Hymenobacter aquaticus]|uniref:Universal stress protein n=1 Tax=Hymenobacter aquaticus TaxID=1867101 RepID=A0A4Z0Q1M5_9BACT|nr:universal stress protein [Hymenobacter aquaticus]TGE23887.1 universal stress protein [Hymenobacter aquaticus]
MPPSILVLTSLAGPAEHVVRTAALLTAPLRPHLTLLHQCATPVLAPELAEVLVNQATDQAQAAVALEAMVHHLPFPVDTTVVAAVEALPEAVANAVRRYQPLLLVLGLSQEHHPFGHLPHTQAQALLRTTHRPLLLVPEQPAPLTKLPRRIAIAVDAEEFTPNATTREAAALLQAWQAATTVVHVVVPGEQQAFPGQRALANVHLSRLLPDQPLELYEESGVTPAAGILQAVVDTQAEVLVLIARPRSFLGRLFHQSVTAQVLRHATVPVLLLPAAAPEVPDWMPNLS